MGEHRLLHVGRQSCSGAELLVLDVLCQFEGELDLALAQTLDLDHEREGRGGVLLPDVEEP